jgi:tripartite-type tricarboxylate transporter receptor subunit TctC
MTKTIGAEIMKLSKYFFINAVLVICTLFGACSAGAADKFPLKPIRFIVSVSPGSQADLLARIIASEFYAGSGQATVVENRPGGAGVVAAQLVAAAPTDGYTLLVAPAGFAVSAVLYPKLMADAAKHLTGISQISSGSNVLVVNKDLNVNNVRELIELAKSKPGVLNYGSTGLGSSGHINGEMFKQNTDTDIMHIAYKGAPEAITDLLSGRIQLFFSSIASAIPYIKDGPTMQEAGVKNFDFDQWFALLAPQNTPTSVLEILSKELARVLALPDVQQRMQALGAIAKPSTPEQTDRLVDSSIAQYTRIVNDAGIKAQ